MCVNQRVFSDKVTVEDVCSGCSFCMTENTKQRNRTTVGGVLRGEKMRTAQSLGWVHVNNGIVCI